MPQRLVRFDWAMKKLLRSKANFGILEGFLSELLKQDLKILNILEGESNKRNQNGKQNRVDILVQLQSGEIVLIEVQVDNEYDYFYRMLYGVSNIITEYLKQGEAYSNIKKIYSVNILYFDLGQGEDYIYHGTTKFIGMHDRGELNLSQKQKNLFGKSNVAQIYPEYYLIKVNRFDDVAKDTLDEWIYFLKHEEIKDSFHAKGLLEAKKKLNELQLSEVEHNEYKRYLDDLHYQASMVETAKADADYNSGLIEGERRGKVEMVRKMKASGMSNDLIQQVIELSMDEIEKI